MSRRPTPLLIDDMIERIERIERFIAGLEREDFLRDEKTADSSSETWKSSAKLPAVCHRRSGIITSKFHGVGSSDCATGSFTTASTLTSTSCGRS